MFGELALKYLLKYYDFSTILNIGSGDGIHSIILKQSGKNVTDVDFGTSYYAKQNKNQFISADYLTYHFMEPFDCVWVCHVLEHQPNPNFFLKKINSDLKENGILALTVPPLKHSIVGGHVSLWNGGLLLYHLILAGFDCRLASLKQDGYNISIILKKQSIKQLPDLSYDCGDLNNLKEFFPLELQKQYPNLERFNGDIKDLNWKNHE